MPPRKFAAPVLQRVPLTATPINVARLLAGIRARRVRSCIDSLADAVNVLDPEMLERVRPHIISIEYGCEAILEELGR